MQDKEEIDLKDDFSIIEISEGIGMTTQAVYSLLRAFKIETTQSYNSGPLRVDRRQRERLLACVALRKETGMHTQSINKLSNEFIMQILSKL